MKKWRNKILSAVLTLSLLLTTTSFAFAVGDGSTTEENIVQIPREQLSIEGFSSQQYKPTGNTGSNSETAKNEGPATNAIDGNTGTFWHTIWTGTDPDTNMSAGNDHDKYIIIDLGNIVYLKQFTLLPRQSGGSTNVRIGNYSVYTATTLKDDGTPNFSNTATKTVEFADTIEKKTVTFDEAVLTRYVKIQATDSHDYATIAELEFFMDASYNPSIVTQPQSASYTVGATAAPLTVSATSANDSGSVSYQWYKSENRDYNGSAINQNGTGSSYTPDVTTAGNYYYYVAVTDSETNATIYSDIVTIGVADSQGDYAAMVDSGYYNDLSSAVAAADNGDTVTILKNIDLTSGIDLTNKIITIKSKENQNYIVKRSIRFDTFLFKINGTANVTFENITIDGGKKNNVHTTGTLINVSGGTVTLGVGTILQNNNNEATGGGGAAMYIIGGITNLDGATIKENTATCDGAIYMSGGTVNVNDGVITGNTARNGGAIYVNGGTLNLNGGTITENTVTTNGGAVYVNNNATLNLNGGTITGNTATNGGALYLQGGTVNLGAEGHSNELKISGNTASSNGNGICFYKTMVTINAILDLSDNIYYIGNDGKTIAINTDLTGSKPITIINDGNRTANQILNARIAENNEARYISAALEVFKVIKSGNQREIYFNGTQDSPISQDTNLGGEKFGINYMDTNTLTVNKTLTSEATYLKGVNDSIFEVSSSGDAVYYKWYILNTETGLFEYKEGGLESLPNDEYTVYCVATTQNGDFTNVNSDSGHYLISDVATVTVKDFVPCSQAIEKFKGI